MTQFKNHMQYLKTTIQNLKHKGETRTYQEENKQLLTLSLGVGVEGDSTELVGFQS